MIFCNNCFQDIEIQAIIKSHNHKGKCPLCGKKGYLYNSDSDNSLEGIFDKIISVYTPEQDLPINFPKDNIGCLPEMIKKDWDIFNDISIDNIREILLSTSPSMQKDFPTIFSGKVGIAEKFDIKYLGRHSILRTGNWLDFVNTIKHQNRFHANLIDTDILRTLCLSIQKDIPISKQRFYRGRIAQGAKGYSRSEMGAPPHEKATAGRANAMGISRLYLTYSRETTFHEIRAAEFDYVTIGTFKLLQPIKVVDLRKFGNISPFASESDEFDCTSLAINRDHLKKINQEISRTMRRGDSPLDYIPTQYICDFIMSITDENNKPVFDGIEYQSAMHSTGANLTIFYPEKFKCTYCTTYEVTELKYKKKPI